MTKLEERWHSEMQRRFADREDIGESAVYQTFFAPLGCSRNGVVSLFAVIKELFGITGGFLRPDDPLDKLLLKVDPENLWQSMVYDVRAGDRELALLEELNDRMRKMSSSSSSQKLETIGDLAIAWCKYRGPA
jgi:hypothetical protein